MTIEVTQGHQQLH